MQETIEVKLLAMGITLPSPPSLIANYAPFASAGNLLFKLEIEAILEIEPG